MLVFRLLSRLAVVGMVAILFAPFGVAAGGLNVSVGGGADPDVGPCRRDDQGAYALENRRVRDPPALGVEVDEAFSRRRRIAGLSSQM
jgi:hypothetical protein